MSNIVEGLEGAVTRLEKAVSGACEEIDRLRAEKAELLDALLDLRAACTDAYKAGRIPAEPFVAAGNVIAKAKGEA